MKITKKRLEAVGFTYRDLGDEAPYEIWERDGVEVWCFNGEHWLVDALDQGGISVEFKTIEQLNEFWLACKLPSILPSAERHQQAVTSRSGRSCSSLVDQITDAVLSTRHTITHESVTLYANGSDHNARAELQARIAAVLTNNLLNITGCRKD